MWWFAFLCFLVASMFAPKAVGIGSLVLIATWVIWKLFTTFREPEGETGDVGHNPAKQPTPHDTAAPAIRESAAPPQTQAIDPAAGLQESDEEFLARQRAANFNHDPSNG